MDALKVTVSLSDCGRLIITNKYNARLNELLKHSFGATFSPEKKAWLVDVAKYEVTMLVCTEPHAQDLVKALTTFDLKIHLDALPTFLVKYGVP